MDEFSTLSLSSSFSPASLYLSCSDGSHFYRSSPDHPSSGLLKIMEESQNFMHHSSLDYVAVDVGPGGFTSTRLAFSLAVGVASACSVPVIPIFSMEALAAKAFNERVLPSVIVSLLLKPDLVLISVYEVGSSSIKEILSKKIMSKNEFRAWFEENYSPASSCYGSGFLLICDDYRDVCFCTVNHTAFDVYSAAKLRFSGLENCCHASDVYVDYATLPSALTLEEQVNLMQGRL